MDKKILHTVIDNHAIVTPNKLALKEFSGKQISYIRFKEESDSIAKFLCLLNIGTGKVIGVFMPAAIDYVVSILGVNKSGNIFMPLSPDYPENRLVNLVERVQPECYITNEENLKDLKRLLGTIEAPIVTINAIETNCIWYGFNVFGLCIVSLGDRR